jgi:hypothetical protein
MTVVLCIFTANKNGVAFQLHPEELKKTNCYHFLQIKTLLVLKMIENKTGKQIDRKTKEHKDK